jgi:Protein of unknown function (DUF1214)
MHRESLRFQTPEVTGNLTKYTPRSLPWFCTVQVSLSRDPKRGSAPTFLQRSVTSAQLGASPALYIMKESPGKAKEANWLPAPNDTIYLVMRLYWPKETPPSILPAGDGTWKPPTSLTRGLVAGPVREVR